MDIEASHTPDDPMALLFYFFFLGVITLGIWGVIKIGRFMVWLYFSLGDQKMKTSYDQSQEVEDWQPDVNSIVDRHKTIVWITKEGVEMTLADFEDSHLVNVVLHMEKHAAKEHQAALRTAMYMERIFHNGSLKLIMKDEINNMMLQGWKDLLPNTYPEFINEIISRNLLSITDELRNQRLEEGIKWDRITSAPWRR